MASFRHVATLSGAPYAYLTGITDLALARIGGSIFLYSATGPGGGLTAFRLTDGLPAALVDQRAFLPGGGQSQTALGMIDAGGGEMIVAGGRLQQALEGLRLDADGGFGQTTAFTGDAAFLGDMIHMTTVEAGGVRYLYAAGQGTGIEAYRVTGPDSVTYLGWTGDSAQTYGADTAAFATMLKGGKTFVFSASATEDGVTSYLVGADGRLSVAGSAGADQCIGIDAPTAIEAVQFGGHGYVVVAGGGSSSLSVLRVNDRGKMWAVDHWTDSLQTRFQHVDALETIIVKGRVFVLAGGADDGISAFELIWGGHLRYIGSIADSAATALKNVSAIAATLVDTEIQVFAAGEGEAGITQLVLDLGRIDKPIYGTGGADDLRGSGKNDLIHGKSGDDFLKGNGGDDVLVDGAGSDVLVGGPGADVFLFEADRTLDKILDYEPGIDRIDLSAWDMLYSLDQLDFFETETGIRIRYGAERLVIQTADFTPLTKVDFSPDDFLFG